MRRRLGGFSSWLLRGPGRLLALMGDTALRREVKRYRADISEQQERIETLEMKLRAADDRERYLGSVIATMNTEVRALQETLARQISGADRKR